MCKIENMEKDMCRLCFAKEDEENEVYLVNIRPFFPFLDVLTGISQDPRMPQQICSSCEFIIESSQLLRQRVQLSETLWSKYTNTITLPKKTREILFNCHMCKKSFNYQNLIAHVSKHHGEMHLEECDFCHSLVSEYSNARISQYQSDDATGTFEEHWVQPEIHSDEEMEDEEEYDVDQHLEETDEAIDVNSEVIPNTKGKCTSSNIKDSVDLNQYLEEVLEKSDDGDPQIFFRCTICDKLSNRKFNGRRHLRIMHPDIVKEYLPKKKKQKSSEIEKQMDECGEENSIKVEAEESCDQTKRVSETTEERKHYMKSSADYAYLEEVDVMDDDGKTNIFYRCKICQKVSNRRYNGRRHLMIMHPELTSIIQLTREQVYSLISIEKITNEAGESDTIKKCKACGLQSKFTANLTVHVKRKHYDRFINSEDASKG